jgi:glucosamine-6-phosphate deaminase
MPLLICRNAGIAATRLADIIEATVRSRSRLNLGLATGRTSARAYEVLIKRHTLSPDLTFRHVTAFNTDEFVGVPAQDPRSARYFMNYHFYRHIDIAPENTFVPCGVAADLEAECKAFELLLQARGGLDLVVLGLGHNGHVGFNEPGSTIRSRTRAVDFTESTLAALSDGSRFESLRDTPTQALTLGLGTILEARHLVLIATGIGKANAVHRMFDTRPSPQVPASLLQAHPQLTVIVDEDAASGLKHVPEDAEHVG